MDEQRAIVTKDNSLGEVVEQGKTLVKNETKFMTAVQVQKPRNLTECVGKLDQIVELMPESMYYSWDIKTKYGKNVTVEGPTIGAANAILCALGNNICEIELEKETDTHWYIKAYYIDLETGSNNSRLFRQRKSQVEGRYDSERQMDMAFQIGISKAKRNVILESNKWIVDYMMKKAKEMEVKAINKDLTNARENALNYFKNLKIPKKKLEEKLEKPMPMWTAEDVAVLRGYVRAISNGEQSLDEIFSEKKKDEKVEIRNITAEIIPVESNKEAKNK